MAFTGFDFRHTQSGGTAFPTDPAGCTSVLDGATYAAGGTPGYVAGGGYPSAYIDVNNAPDGRLGGAHSSSSIGIQFKVDVPNGDYDIRIAAASTVAATQCARVYFGGGASDFIDITSNVSGTATNVPTGSQMDATGAILTNANWISSQGTVRVTVKDGAGLRIGKNTSGALQLRHFAYQAVTAPLKDTTLDTDETGVKISTTGTTAAGSNAVSGLASPVGIAVGMTVTGPAIPAGVTVAAIGAQDASTGAITSLTLSTGTGVLAATGGALRFGYAPGLYEKQAFDKLIAPITVAVGGGQVANLAVQQADGTAHPHIGVKLADPMRTGTPTPWLYHTTKTFPGTATTHTFKIVQTDTSGVYSGSPYTTTFTLPVTLAPSKPTTGFYSMISTGAWLLRSTILSKFSAGLWKGYRGQAITASAVATSFLDLSNKMTTFAAQAGGGKWFSILLDAAGDWTTSLNGNGLSYDFKPWEGGGLIIAPATLPPLMKGGLYTRNQRGVQYQGLTWTGGIQETGGGSIRLDADLTKPLTIVHFEKCKFGALWDSANTDASVALKTDNSYGSPFVAIKVLRGADQVSGYNNEFFGCADAFQIHAARLISARWNTFRRIYGDNYPIAPGGLTYPYTEAGVATAVPDNYWDIGDNISYASMDNPSTYVIANGSLGAPHPDFIQIRNIDASGGETTQNDVWLLEENNITHSNVVNYATNDGGTTRYDVSRQFNIHTGPASVRSVVINNVGASMLIRGMDDTNVVDGYSEYNTMAGAARMPPSGPSGSTQFASLPLATVATGGKPGRKRIRKNIVANGNFGPALGSASEDNVFVNWSGAAPYPGTALTGPFRAETGDTTSTRQIYDFPADALTSAAKDVRKATWATFRPIVDAGAQFVRSRINPGESDTLTAVEAASLEAVTDSRPLGVQPGIVSLRWNNGAGETGAQAGSDVTFSVQ